ncbi:hypothetical protein ACRRTK_017475 [Alexandromys fortis]
MAPSIKISLPLFSLSFPFHEKVGSSLESIGTGSHFLNRTPVAQTLRATINKQRSFS